MPTVSLHVHERVDPRTIIEAVPSGRKSSSKVAALSKPISSDNPLSGLGSSSRWRSKSSGHGEGRRTWAALAHDARNLQLVVELHGVAGHAQRHANDKTDG